MLRLSLHRRRQLMPWIFLGPGLAWLVVFFATPPVPAGHDEAAELSTKEN